AKQLYAAVAFLHQHLIAHRDVKPENIVIDGAGILTLVDYSTAKDFSQENPLIDAAVGTRDWIAPEVELCFNEHTRKPYCPFRADIWAVGNVL
ncbi:kinase-like domain-containing protein, partial [Pterulicium gracile]